MIVYGLNFMYVIVGSGVHNINFSIQESVTRVMFNQYVYMNRSMDTQKIIKCERLH